jgi:hypothetical protein
MLMMPTRSLISHFTGLSSMRSRISATSNGLSRPGRTTVSVILLPGVPRIASTASSSVPAVEQLAVEMRQIVVGL